MFYFKRKQSFRKNLLHRNTMHEPKKKMNENFVKNLQNQKFHQIFHQNKIHTNNIFTHQLIASPQEVKKIFAKPQFF